MVYAKYQCHRIGKSMLNLVQNFAQRDMGSKNFQVSTGFHSQKPKLNISKFQIFAKNAPVEV